MMESRPLLRVVIKEEFVALTENVFEAVILQQMLYWQERVKDYDKMIKEEQARMEKHKVESDFQSSNGWIYKKAEELAEETLLCLSAQTIRRHLGSLVKKELILERRNPLYKWDKTLQYRINFQKLVFELNEKGYSLEGYTSLPIPNLQPGVSNLQNGVSNNQNGDSKIQVDVSDIQNGGAIPEITTEITPDNLPVREQAPKTDKIPVPQIQEATAKLFLSEGKKGKLSDDDISCLKMLFTIHTPAAIQQQILTSFERLQKKGSVKVEFEGKEYVITKPEKLPVRYIYNSMKNWSSLKGTGKGGNRVGKTRGHNKGNPGRENKDYTKGAEPGMFVEG